MRDLKRYILLGLAALFLVGLMEIAAPAQRRTVVVRRPVVVHRIYYRHYDPFWRGTLWDPYWGYDPYFYDPYLRAQRERYYLQDDVKDKRKDLAKHREKYNSDGYLTPKEREKLAKDQEKYAKAVAKLNRFNRGY